MIGILVQFLTRDKLLRLFDNQVFQPMKVIESNFYMVFVLFLLFKKTLAIMSKVSPNSVQLLCVHRLQSFVKYHNSNMSIFFVDIDQ